MNWIIGAAFLVLVVTDIWPELRSIWLVSSALGVFFAIFIYRMVTTFLPTKVLIDDEGVHVRNYNTAAEMAWRDVERIEVSRYESDRGDVFCADLYRGNEDGLSVFDFYKGFDTFQAAIFKRWPGIMTCWTSVLTGPPSEEEPDATVLWRRSDS